MTNTTTESSKPAKTEPIVESPEKVLIVNHDARIYYLTVGREGRQVRFVPGVSFIEPKDWADILKQAKAKTDELASFLLQDGRLQELGAGDGTVSGMPASKAIGIVQKTLDRKLLNRWGDDETRPTVQKAIAKQLELLDGSKKD